MHPFCCASLVPVSPSAASAAAAAGAPPAAMPPPQPPPVPPPPPLRSNSAPGERRVRVAGADGSGGGSSPPEGVKLNEIVGGGISGILYKWVNYGRGWRPRWFALQDGVLSYYKIHGPDRIVLSRETERGAKVIGEDSIRRLSRPSISSYSHSNGHHQPPKPMGEIHLKVSIGSARPP
jgi:oxysterol-binding protein 1